MDHLDRILEQWQRERPDLDAAPMATFGRIKRLSLHLAHRVEAVLAEYDLTGSGFDVLATLRRSGPPFALSPSKLMEWTMVTSGTMTNRIDRLEAAGYVSRIRNPDDGRGFLIALTDEGRALVDRAVEAHVANEHALMAALTDDDRATLDRLLAKWLAAFEGDGADSENKP